MITRSMSNSQLNKEKMVTNNEIGSLTDVTINAPLQNGDNDQNNNRAASADINDPADVQLVHSPLRSVRRFLSNAYDDDQFQVVTHKKSRLKNHGNNNNNQHHHHQVHFHQVSDIENNNVNNVPNSSSSVLDASSNQ